MIGIIPLIKLMSLWKSVNLNGLYWTKLPNKNYYIARMKLSGKKSIFSNLLNPEIVLTIDPGRYEVKIYTEKKVNCINWNVSNTRYTLAVNIATNKTIIINQAKD